jgi:hypothetical protein
LCVTGLGNLSVEGCGKGRRVIGASAFEVGVKPITIDLTIVVSKDIFIDRSIDVYDVDL